jgi:diadenosine tetraphosphatase ApaH/serine/threonine PP2A family protein phosphatase
MTSTIAIIADIHANLEALTAVMSDIAKCNVETIYCLGDVVGYGPNPRECIDIAMTFAIRLMGNHDKIALEGEPGRQEARRFVQWTRRQIGISNAGTNDADRRRDFLRCMPLTYHEQGNFYVHGSPRDPLNEYVFPAFIFDHEKTKSIFDLVDGCCFIGHTHLPGIITPEYEFFTPDQIGGKWHIRRGMKLLCNVGSVGQPRDDDNRACYCLFDGNTIQFRRVEYDIATTSRKLNDLFPPQ